jgi:hypothetical protein
VIEIASGAMPTTLEGEPLDNTNLHDWLSLPISHFIDKNPSKSRQELIEEACEVVAELVASCGHDWPTVRPYGQLAMDALNQAIPEKFKAHDRARRNRN